ncbi:MAG: phage major capsid protein [Alphaproteobacteria bacterium]
MTDLNEIKAAVDDYHVTAAEGLGGLKSRLETVEARLDTKARFDTSMIEPMEVLEHKHAFDIFMRSGETGGLADLELKALSVGTAAEGGYAVPEEIDREIERLLADISPIRTIAKVVEIGTSDYKKLVNVGGATTGWVGETAARTETDTPQFAEVVPPLGEIYANPAATQHMLDDAFFNVEEWLAGEIAEEIAEAEGAAFVSGNGINKPKGFLDYTTATTGDASRTFGTLQHLATGAAGAWPSSNPTDILIDLAHTLRPAYRQSAHWVMNTNTVAAIRKFKDADGNYIWREGDLTNGQPARLLGYPVVEAEDMPDIAADSLSVAFGDFSRGYLVTDRLGTRVLRDPFSNKPYVHFYTTKRVGGGVVNSEAIKLLKFSLT